MKLVFLLLMFWYKYSKDYRIWFTSHWRCDYNSSQVNRCSVVVVVIVVVAGCRRVSAVLGVRLLLLLFVCVCVCVCVSVSACPCVCVCFV